MLLLNLRSGKLGKDFITFLTHILTLSQWVKKQLIENDKMYPLEKKISFLYDAIVDTGCCWMPQRYDNVSYNKSPKRPII